MRVLSACSLSSISVFSSCTQHEPQTKAHQQTHTITHTNTHTTADHGKKECARMRVAEKQKLCERKIGAQKQKRKGEAQEKEAGQGARGERKM